MNESRGEEGKGEGSSSKQAALMPPLLPSLIPWEVGLEELSSARKDSLCVRCGLFWIGEKRLQIQSQTDMRLLFSKILETNKKYS